MSDYITARERIVERLTSIQALVAEIRAESYDDVLDVLLHWEPAETEFREDLFTIMDKAEHWKRQIER